MKEEIDDYSGEFIGEIKQYCIDGNTIWFYDELSGGLYQLDKKSYIVEIVLEPMEIHQKEIFPVRQILKWENEIYLIPKNISHEWLIYNIVDKQLRSLSVSSQSFEIDKAVIIGKWIYLIPEKTSHMMAIMETGTLNVKTIATNWYKNDIREYEYWCWGHSLFEDIIVFPIIGTREIFQIQGGQMIKLPLHIKKPIYSISLTKKGIWILPSEGNDILFADRNGEFIESVRIYTNKYKNVAEQFGRIIAIDRYVYLFPRRGGQILALETNSKEWISIGNEEESCYYSLYHKTTIASSYWGYYCNGGKLYTLPLRYRYAEIDIESKSVNYKNLRYATTRMKQQYMLWVHWFHARAKIYFMELEKESLRNFCKIAIALENSIAYSKESIGKKIWVKMLGR